MSPFSASLLTNLKIEKVEKVDDEDCYVISGSSPVSKDIRIWISTQGYLVKEFRYSFESPGGIPAIPEMTDQQLDETIKAMGQQPTPETRAKVRDMMKQSQETLKNSKMKVIFCEHYRSISTPELKPMDFEFKVPEGAVLKDSFLAGVPEPKMAGSELLSVKMSEGIVGVGMIRSALRDYAGKHGGAYPTLAGVKGDGLEPALGISVLDLSGKDFKPGSYTVTSSPKAYTITAALGAETYIINQDGVESGTYRTDR